MFITNRNRIPKKSGLFKLKKLSGISLGFVAVNLRYFIYYRINSSDSVKINKLSMVYPVLHFI
jgi:hypothetical protein